MGKALMVQGTSSHVGKSLMVAALCRIFLQDGFRVAPFKAQNMSNNSYVTPDGGEIGRAQAVQAEAAAIEPSVEMNPILLKPEADDLSQVVVMGKRLTALPAQAYYSSKDRFWSFVTESLEKLLADYKIVGVEGAGSPAEVNLRDNDIVNMRVARYAKAPVLLVADIDRGGVFASLVGTLELLEPDERATIKAFIINKFRGDIGILRPGLEGRTGVPVAGVIPYFGNIQIAEEDSVADKPHGKAEHTAPLDVAVVCLPHISNFDDFDPLEREPDVGLRYVHTAHDLGTPDMVILPGDQGHGGRPGLAADTGDRGPHPVTGPQRYRDHGHLRRVPDAGGAHSGPRGPRVQACRGQGIRTLARRHRLRGYQGDSQNQGRRKKSKWGAARGPWASHRGLRNPHGALIYVLECPGDRPPFPDS